ncbi:MAG TPA: SDR family NAD(P)-dependent oxidoreductase [Acidimicrobiia bacterium]
MSPVDSFGRSQTVLVLGGNSDLGQAIARRMVDDGARTVILAGRDPERPTDPPIDADTDHRYFDAADTASHDKFFNEVFSDHPNIDAVVIAFGVLHSQGSVDQRPELAVEMAQVNYVGAASALLHSERRLRERGGGQLVVLSSLAGLQPRPSNFSYGSTKAGIDFLARGLARTSQRGNVHVLVVRPGFVHTAMTADLPSRPFAVGPEDVADAVVEALSRRAGVVFVPAILKWVMWVLRLLPYPIVARLDR